VPSDPFNRAGCNGPADRGARIMNEIKLVFMNVTANSPGAAEGISMSGVQASMGHSRMIEDSDIAKTRIGSDRGGPPSCGMVGDTRGRDVSRTTTWYALARESARRGLGRNQMHASDGQMTIMVEPDIATSRKGWWSKNVDPYMRRKTLPLAPPLLSKIIRRTYAQDRQRR